VADNGMGFDMAQLKRPSGLRRMRERAASINADLTIESQPGKGTTIIAIIDPS